MANLKSWLGRIVDRNVGQDHEADHFVGATSTLRAFICELVSTLAWVP
jgi:hypothetical protein